MRETLSIPDPLPDLSPASHGGFDLDDAVRVERVSYGTQYGMRIPALLYLPRHPAGRIPGLLIVPGHGGDKHSWYARYAGALYARAGAAVLTFDPVGEGERNDTHRSRSQAHDRLSPDAEDGRRVTGLMVTDLLQGVSYLRRREEIDPSRIAVLGFSLGSYATALAGAVDSRPWVAVMASGGNLDGAGGYWDSSRPMCQGFSYQALRFLGDRPAALYAMHAQRGPSLIVLGGNDTVVRAPRLGALFLGDLQDRVAHLLEGKRGEIFSWKIVDAGGHQPFFLGREVAGWLEEEIDLPAWSVPEIAAFPQVRIGEWADRQGIDLGHLGRRSDRDAGTEALPASIPRVPSEDLDAFTPAEWQALKTHLVLESWVESMHAEERQLRAEGLLTHHLPPVSDSPK
ncbi:MAG TPA: prolyl oligopeptidase family serine peptidase [Candidatus Polarisedimenticolia bacterium]|nr:prolyl oligopeptidase family serine peptidase [Candidatus Polarisedimenticolia bacterium]